MRDGRVAASTPNGGAGKQRGRGMIMEPESFDSNSRARLVHLLRQGPRSADELARGLGITVSAVRQHLATLERDSVIARRGLRRLGTVGKPATVYEVTPEAEAAYSKAYAPVLAALLATLPGYLEGDRLDDLLRDVGSRLGAAVPAAGGTLRERAEAAASLLDALGGLTEIIDQSENCVVLAGCSCPLRDAVAAQPGMCRALERMLALTTGLTVRECCDREQGPRCRFELTAGAGA